MKDIERFKSAMAIDKALQADASSLEPESAAYVAFAKYNGYNITLDEVEAIFKDLLWLARVGDDIDHA